MGQDQSNTLGIRHSPSVTPSSSSTSHNRTLLQNKIFIHQHLDEEDEDLGNSRMTEEDEEEGIIRVVEGPGEEEEDEELKLLHSIKKFDPFIKEQEKNFSIEHLLGLKTSPKSTPSAKENDLPVHPAVEVFFDLQAHLKEHMAHINNEQRTLLRRIAYVDKLSSTSAQTISTAFSQARLASERVSEAALLKEQAAKAQAYAINIFKSFTVLEKYLDPEDRIQINGNSKWPELDELRTRASKFINPPFDRITKSTTTNDLTTVGTSTSPLLERVVVTGEPAFPPSDNIMESNTENDPSHNTGTSSSTSSLALSRLRGLSSRSIRLSDNTNDV